jgi:hypothetical protein
VLLLAIIASGTRSVKQAIDALAGKLTGDPEFFWNKPAQSKSA